MRGHMNVQNRNEKGNGEGISAYTTKAYWGLEL
jgi:hypothetical protein